MADISLRRTHHLGLKGAHAAANKMVAKLDQKFNLSGDWEGNTLHFERPGVTGRLTISETDMKLEVTLGFLLKMMKGPIEQAVHEQLEQVLGTPPSRTASHAAASAKKPAPKKK